jgi:hypothetical protein
MKIDIHNYEAFFLDFVEGRLDDASTLKMLAFLSKHPDLKAELENFSDIRLETSKTAYNEKDQLKKFEFLNSHVNLKNFEDYCIAHYEKLLSSVESEKLFAFLELNPQKKADFDIYGKAYLKAEEAVVFEAKPFLKKRPKRAIRAIILKWTAVAAGIALIISVFYKSTNNETVKLPKPLVASESIKVVEKPLFTEDFDKASDHPNKNKVPIIASRVKDTRVNDNNVREVMMDESLQLLQPIAVSELETVQTHSEIVLANTSTKNVNDEVEDFEVLDYAEKVLRKKVLKNIDQPRIRFSLWDLADITLKGYNRISESDIILHRKTDEKGKLTVFAIETENKKYGFESKN